MNRREKEIERLQRFPDVRVDDLERQNIHGVLLADEIEFYATKYKMIEPFERENLKPAAYELTVGNEYALGGEIKELFDESGKDQIKIPAFQVVVIKTAQTVNLPRFIIARWNIRVRWAYEGLAWVGGPQVDPGYVGHLFCPIYNLSNKEVTLRLGEPIAIIDFVKTTRFKESIPKEYQYTRPPKRVVFEDYNPDRLKSALYTEAKERIEGVSKRVDATETRIDRFTATVLTVVGVLFTALAILASSGRAVQDFARDWSTIGFALAVIALIISTLTYRATRPKQ